MTPSVKNQINYLHSNFSSPFQPFLTSKPFPILQTSILSCFPLCLICMDSTTTTTLLLQIAQPSKFNCFVRKSQNESENSTFYHSDQPHLDTSSNLSTMTPPNLYLGLPSIFISNQVTNPNKIIIHFTPLWKKKIKRKKRPKKSNIFPQKKGLNWVRKLKTYKTHKHQNKPIRKTT